MMNTCNVFQCVPNFKITSPAACFYVLIVS
nr:MAG TPA: hypothetical protein [Caudoviricetes sp.]